MEIIKDLDIVALTEDLEATHFETKQRIKLFKGQVGTVVMEFDGSAFEVEFSHQDRSPLTPLKKGGTRKLLKSPLLSGDLGGSPGHKKC